MPPSILDTDILSEVLRGRNESVAKRAERYRAAFTRLSTTLITVTEVVKGYRQLGRDHDLQRFLAGLPAMELLTLDLEIATLGGSIAGDLVRTGQTIGDFDPLIAAIAIAHDRTLVTGNTRHYQRIVELGYDLKLDDWRQPAR